MAKQPGGRPRGGEERGSRLVRLNEDLAEMIAWIVKVEGGTAATLCDPLLRPQITARYKSIEQLVKQVREHEEKANELLRRAAEKRRKDHAGE